MFISLFFLPRFLSCFFFLSFIYSFSTVIWLALCISLLKMISYFPKTQCLQRIPSKLFIASNPSSYPLTCIEPQPIVIPSQKLSSFHWMKIIEKAQNHANALYLCDLSKLQMENHNKHTRIIIEDLMRVLTIQMQKSFFFFFNKWIWKKAPVSLLEHLFKVGTGYQIKQNLL